MYKRLEGIKMSVFGDNRMRKEHYNTLQKSVNEVVVNVGLTEIKEFRKTVKFIDNQFTAFVWVLWRNATDQEFRTELYKYLNDAHVETALKKILSAYKEIR